MSTPNGYKKGITLLLVIVILSALVSISIGIFNVVFGEILISGELADSYKAFYAADRAIDKFLYLDRNSSTRLNDGDQEDTTPSASPTGCYVIKIFKTPATILSECQVSDPAVSVCIKSVGQFRCDPGSSRLVKRGFTVLY